RFCDCVVVGQLDLVGQMENDEIKRVGHEMAERIINRTGRLKPEPPPERPDSVCNHSLPEASSLVLANRIECCAFRCVGSGYPFKVVTSGSLARKPRFRPLGRRSDVDAKAEDREPAVRIL